MAMMARSRRCSVSVSNVKLACAQWALRSVGFDHIGLPRAELQCKPAPAAEHFDGSCRLTHNSGDWGSYRTLASISG